GERARIHTGIIAQRLQKVFSGTEADLDRYGLFCYSSWEAMEPEYDENGELADPGHSAGDLYSIRYEEALCVEAAYLRRENARLKKRVADLEERLAALELKTA
ncbi:MAG: tail fiber domain-containing protein, partial [Clostridia bacterium]|nr:tail fiber domain-containing protein [Clostridia bacterium]